MASRFFLPLLVFLVWPSPQAAWGQEEEILGKKKSQWLAILKTHKETKFRRAALIALEVIGPKSPGVLTGLFEALEKDGEPEIRREAALTLGRMGTDAKGAVDVLADTLKRDKADAVREAAALALAGRLNEQAHTQVLILAGALKDPHAGTRAAAAEALKNMGVKARLALPQLTEVAKDKKADRFPRLFAIQIISRHGDEGTLKVLLAIAADKDAATAIRQAALEGIGRHADQAPAAALPILIQSLKEKDVAMRRAAAVVLALFGAKAKSAWPAAQDAYKDTDTAVRYQVIRLAGALVKDLRAPLALLLEAAQKETTLENRLAAIQELGQIETASPEVLPVLTKLANDDPRVSIREAAQAALKKLKGTP